MLQIENEVSETTVAAALTRLDQLSVRFMVEGRTGSTLMELTSTGNEAGNRGSSLVAERVERLVADLQKATDLDADATLKTGMTELRVMIENEKHSPSSSSAPPYATLGEDAELIADFLVEAREHLSLIEGQMLSLERDPSAMEVIHAVFRAFHTIKGLAGFLGFPVIQAVAHEVETLLDLARNEKVRVESRIVDVVLESADFLLTEMASIDQVLAGAPSIDPADSGALIARIRSLASPSSGEDVEVPAKLAAPAEEMQPSSEVETSCLEKAKTENKRFSEQSALQEATAASSNEEGTRTLTLSALKPETEAIQAATDEFFPSHHHPQDAKQESATVDSVTPLPPSSSEAVVLAPGAGTTMSMPGKTVDAPRSADLVKAPDVSSVRVDTAKLDHLMDMVGEMVIAQSLIRHSQLLLTTTDSRLVGDLSHLARVTAEVQRATMSMRMVPVAQLFQKIERVIRDLSRKAGKQVVLLTSGTDTEVDKTVAEELSDPLLHMVRNSVDHGIEVPEDRIASGKDPVAQIKLAAYHQGGQVVIEISDDGRGLNAERIRAKAEQKEIISAGTQLTELEVYQLIFEPGFSTAEKITDVSGRGVGMDVVRRNVEKLRGRIETQSRLGSGTTFLLKLPLTLAIIDGLVVEVGSNHYIVPLSVVREIFRPASTSLFTVERREEMVLVREQLLPIVRLNQRLSISSRIANPADGLLVVIESENKLYCLLVDDLLGKQEVVIKSLGETFRDASGFSGCAVLGNGRVGLILDTDGLYRGGRR